MGAARDLRARLAEPRPLILDGATGTELERRGVDCALPLWSARALLECPERVAEIHADYVEAGAGLLTANTFRTQRRTLERAGLGAEAARLTALAVELAREAARAAGRPVFVAGSAPPLEDCFRPERVPDDAALRREHAEHAGHLAAAGVDAILIETMNSAREAVAAARAARRAGLPAVVCFACGEGARLLSGEPLRDALAAVGAEAPAAVGVNCLPPSRVPACLEVLAEQALPFAVYANAGRGETCSPADLLACARTWVAAGARLVGGCCGTTPAHLRRLVSGLNRRA